MTRRPSFGTQVTAQILHNSKKRLDKTFKNSLNLLNTFFRLEQEFKGSISPVTPAVIDAINDVLTEIREELNPISEAFNNNKILNIAINETFSLLSDLYNQLSSLEPKDYANNNIRKKLIPLKLQIEKKLPIISTYFNQLNVSLLEEKKKFELRQFRARMQRGSQRRVKTTSWWKRIFERS